MSKYMLPIFIMMISITNMAALRLESNDVYIIPNEMQQWVDPIDNQYYCQPPTSDMVGV